MRIVVGGSSGFIGTALVDRLRGSGHDVLRLVRREPDKRSSGGPAREAEEVRWRPSVEPLDPAVLDGADAAGNPGGGGGGGHPRDEAYKARIPARRPESTPGAAAAGAGGGA